MTLPSRVIYLPPGVTPAATVAPAGVPTSNPAIPFDRNFFEKILPESIKAFCQQADCEVPMVEISTLDGTKHFVNGISGVADTWVALHTAEEAHDHPVQVFVPYSTIFRVEIHPADHNRHKLGFAVGR